MFVNRVYALLLSIFCGSSLMAVSSSEQAFFQGHIDSQELQEAFASFPYESMYQRFEKDLKPCVQDADALQKDVYAVWSVFRAYAHEWYAEKFLTQLSQFISEGGFAIDFYEIHMMMTIQGFLKQQQEDLKSVQWTIGSTRTEGWVQEEAQRRKLILLLNQSTSSRVFESYIKAIQRSYGQNAEHVFRAWMESMGQQVDVTKEGVAWSHNPLLEQKIMSTIATLDVTQKVETTPEIHLVSSLFQFICTQVLAKREFQRFEHIVEMGGRRLPLVVALFVQSGWVEYLKKNLNQESQYLVSSLAFGAFRTWIDGYDSDQKTWKNIGTFGHKGVSFFESYARQYAAHLLAHPEEQTDDLKNLLLQEGEHDFVVSASLSGELLAFLLQSKNAPFAVALPDLYGIETGMQLLNAYRQHPTPVCIRQDSELLKTIELIESNQQPRKSGDLHVNGAIFSEISHLKDVFFLPSDGFGFPQRLSLGMGGVFFRFPGAPKARSNAVKLMKMTFGNMSFPQETVFPGFEWQDCGKWTGDGKASGNHIDHLRQGQNLQDIAASVADFARDRKEWLQERDSEEAHRVLSVWLKVLGLKT